MATTRSKEQGASVYLRSTVWFTLGFGSFWCLSPWTLVFVSVFCRVRDVVCMGSAPHEERGDSIEMNTTFMCSGFE